MPDPFGDNEALSQDALDALVNSVDSAAAFSASPADEVTSPLIDDSGDEDEEVGSMAYGDAGELPGSMAAQPTSRSPLKMASFDAPAAAAAASDRKSLEGFDRVQDIPLELTVELGRTRLLIKDILELRAGSIVELEKMAGEPVDILANGLLVARGEVVVIEDAFGVRITEIITSMERKALEDDPSTAKAA